MKLDLLRQGLRFAVTVGVSTIIAGMVDKSREDSEDGKVVGTLIKLGALAISLMVADKVVEHMDKRIDETVGLMGYNDAGTLYEDYKEKNEA